MSDRLEESLREALQHADLPEAPDALRRGLEELPVSAARTRVRRITWLRMATMAAGAAALCAVAVFGFWLPLSRGPLPGSSATPGESLIADATSTPSDATETAVTPIPTPGITQPAPTVTPVPTPTDAATPAPTDTPTSEPTVSPTAPPTPTPAPTAIAGPVRASQRTDAGIYFNGHFVLVGRDKGGLEGAWVGDGLQWQRVESPALASMTVSQLIQVGTRLVAFGWAGGPDPDCFPVTMTNAGPCAASHTLSIAVSTDGTTWTAAPASTFATFGHTEMIAAAGSSKGAVAFGLYCPSGTEGICETYLWHSPDGIAWTGRPFPADRAVLFPNWDIHALAATPAGFFGIGGTEAWASSDGSSWTEGTIPPIPYSFYDGQYLYATAAGLVEISVSKCRGGVAVSKDGLSWTEGTLPAGLCRFAGDSTGTVGLSSDGRTLWKSTDGRTWTQLGALAVAGDNPVVVAGPSGVVVASGELIAYFNHR